MLCGFYAVWGGIWVAQCVVFVRNARRGLSWRGGNGLENDLRNFEIIFAQSHGFLGYFECVFAMLSSSSGDSKILGPGSLLATWHRHPKLPNMLV
tara:strand:- start:187 stop:471 length:285 start_codon:yes stop_codon:yes gene_type:complete